MQTPQSHPHTVLMTGTQLRSQAKPPLACSFPRGRSSGSHGFAPSALVRVATSGWAPTGPYTPAPASAGPSLGAPGCSAFGAWGQQTLAKDLRGKEDEGPCPLLSYRIVVAGALLQAAVVPSSAVPFDFQAEYRLSNQLVCVLPSCGLA